MKRKVTNPQALKDSQELARMSVSWNTINAAVAESLWAAATKTLKEAYKEEK